MHEKTLTELSEALAAKHNVTREMQDVFALRSHQKAILAQQQGKFVGEIVPVTVSSNRVFSEDEHPRRNLQIVNFQELRHHWRVFGRFVYGIWHGG